MKFLLVFLLLLPSSEIVTRNSARTNLSVTSKVAQVKWDDKTMVASGAINARPPSESVPQVKFKRQYGATLRGTCGKTKLSLTLLEKICRASDGSYWALQRWQRLVPNYGGTTADEEIEISHWSGELPKFEDVHWTTKYDLPVLCGRFTYRAQGVYGFKSSSTGVPLDTYGRLIYVDAYNSDYGAGWRRVNSFLTHAPDGHWCYLFANHKSGSGRGAMQYAITANGPGVTPVIRMMVNP